MRDSFHADQVRAERHEGRWLVAFARTASAGVIDRHVWIIRHPATGRLHIEYNDPANTADESHIARVVLTANAVRVVFKGPRLLAVSASSSRIDELEVTFAPDPSRPLADALGAVLGTDVPLES